jgi:hypothetical protein
MQRQEGEDAVNNLYDMQCSWFAQELGESYYRLGIVSHVMPLLTGV